MWRHDFFDLCANLPSRRTALEKQLAADALTPDSLKARQLINLGRRESKWVLHFHWLIVRLHVLAISVFDVPELVLATSVPSRSLVRVHSVKLDSSKRPTPVKFTL